MTAPPQPPRTSAAPRGSRASRTSSRPTTRRRTSRGWCVEALETLPSIAETFEIIAVNDGSRDRTREIADRLAAEHPDVVRVVHHDVNRGYGGALRSGFEASRYELLAFTDGDRQFRVADIAPPDGAPRGRRPPGRRGRLPDQARGPDHPRSSTPGPTSWRTGSSSASASATWTAPASCSAARRWTASGSSPAARSSPRSC